MLLARTKAADVPAESGAKGAQVREALILSLQTNLGYCREWLSSNDFKSLGQGISALTILTDALERHVAESGKDKITSLRHAVEKFAAVANAADAQHAQTAIEALSKVVEGLATVPFSDVPRPATKSAAGFTPLMHLIDGTFADAKSSLSAGDVAAARSYTVALVELAQWLAADRAGAQWKSQADDLAAAAQDVASSTTLDPKLLRGQLHDVYARCTACHQRQR
ncbi:MAG TPA: hypothetical protein VFE46_07765 [Pirellulales bacterium]|jgi:hypothetical protein|nr:hypothetical protein [Pirellulales bacterium]